MSTLTRQDLFSSLLEAAPSHFASLRQLAKESYAAQGLPAPKAEEYKFIPITKKIESSISNFSAAQPFEISPEQVQAAIFTGFEGMVLVFTNGYFQSHLSSFTDQLQVNKLSEKPETPVGSIAKASKDVFSALNQATFSEGIFISLPAKAEVSAPILLLQFYQAKGGQVISPRCWIEAGDFAKATFIEQRVSLDEQPYFVNNVVEIQGGIHSNISYLGLQQEHAQAIEVSNLETNLLRDAQFTSVQVSLSGDMIRNNLTINILGSNSVGNMFGIYLLRGKTLVDNHTQVDHQVPHAESHELYKGILADQSRGVFNGKIFVRQEAQKTNAFQQNNNILLSEEAVINTKPQLEIWADDVKCSHGCTVGQLDEEALFYLQARGIEKTAAKGLLLHAFAGEVLDKIQVESFKNFVELQIQDRLGSKF